MSDRTDTNTATDPTSAVDVEVTQDDRDLVARLAALTKADGIEAAHQVIARHRLASLPCKSGEGAGKKPEGLDERCGFGGRSILDAEKSPEWLAACEQLALRYDHWKLTAKATQIRAGHPAWLIEHACVEAVMAALSTPSEQFAKSSPEQGDAK